MSLWTLIEVPVNRFISVWLYSTLVQK